MKVEIPDGLIRRIRAVTARTFGRQVSFVNDSMVRIAIIDNLEVLMSRIELDHERHAEVCGKVER